MTTLYDKVLERYPNGMVTLSKSIKAFCPSDLRGNGAADDDCEDAVKEELKCHNCWMKKLDESRE